jgi:hypothetical protein
MICNFAAQAGGLTTDLLVDRLIAHLHPKGE